MAMRPDFAPLFRSSIGFDRMLDVLEAASRGESLDNWPPYDIVKAGEDDYRIDMAVAGFDEGDLALTQDRNMLIVSGRKGATEGDGVTYLHRGIAARSFERRFELAEHVRVEGARMSNGLLTIDLRRDIPEELKPRRIEIATLAAPAEAPTRQIETSRQPEPAVA